jgi:hypothetical protein
MVLFLSLFRYLARSNAIIAFLIVAFIMATVLISAISFPVLIYAGKDHSPLPDARAITGYTPSQLRSFYTKIGVKGCEAYVQVADFDCYLYMPIYMVCLGTLMVRASDVLVVGTTSSSSEIWALLPVLAVTFDLVETYLQRQGCLRDLEDYEIRGASLAMQSKWVLLAVSIAFIIVAILKWTYQKMSTIWTTSRRTSSASGKQVKQS